PRSTQQGRASPGTAALQLVPGTSSPLRHLQLVPGTSWSPHSASAHSSTSAHNHFNSFPEQVRRRTRPPRTARRRRTTTSTRSRNKFVAAPWLPDTPRRWRTPLQLVPDEFVAAPWPPDTPRRWRTPLRRRSRTLASVRALAVAVAGRRCRWWSLSLVVACGGGNLRF